MIPRTNSLDADIRGAIEDLIADHAWVLDHGDPTDLPDLYTDDGRLLGVGPPLDGRAALVGWAQRRAALTGRVSRHVHTNIRLERLEEDRVRGQLVTLLYRHDGPGDGPSWPMLVLDYHDVYARQADGRWLFAERTVTRVFTDQTRTEAST